MKPRSERDKRYEEKHKNERKAKNVVWGTSIPRETAEEIDAFLKKHGYTKVKLIEEGYKSLLEQAGEINTDFAKIMDGYEAAFSFFLLQKRKKYGTIREEKSNAKKEKKIMIRRATEEDIPALDRLLIEVNGIHAKLRPDLFRDGRKKYTDEELLALVKDEDRPIFVFEEEGKILGYAFCIVLDHTKDTATTGYRTVYIDDLCVDAQTRGSGIGHALYEHVLTFARGIGAYNVTLNVWAGNESARRFYDSLGMKVQKIGMETVL